MLEQELRHKREHTDKKIAQAVQQVLMREWGAIITDREQASTSPNVPRSSPDARWSSCASIGIPGPDTITYLVDGTTT